MRKGNRGPFTKSSRIQHEATSRFTSTLLEAAREGESMNDKPKRIQRKRTKGSKMPPNTVYVGRPSRWGNVFQIGKDGTREQVLSMHREWLIGAFSTKPPDEKYFAPLRGKNLACWCPLNQPCHADVLLE